MPFFSIIVPIYRTEKYLFQCINSILEQTYCNFEVILVDDGSPDRCGEICDHFASIDCRVRVIHKANGGLVSARKAGFEASRGSYIVNVDSDDYIDVCLLEYLAKVIDEYSPQAVLFDLQRFSTEWTSLLENKLDPGLYSGDKIELIHNNLIQNDRGEQIVLYNLCSMVIEREKYGYFQKKVPNLISRGEDLAVSVPILASCDCVYLMRYTGYYYRFNSSSIMNSFREDELDQIELVVNYLSEVLEEEYENKLNVYLLLHYFDFLDRSIFYNRYEEYRKLAKKTLTMEVMKRIRKARSVGPINVRTISFLIRHKCFSILWLLRKIKRRNEIC